MQKLSISTVYRYAFKTIYTVNWYLDGSFSYNMEFWENHERKKTIRVAEKTLTSVIPCIISTSTANGTTGHASFYTPPPPDLDLRWTTLHLLFRIKRLCLDTTDQAINSIYFIINKHHRRRYFKHAKL